VPDPPAYQTWAYQTWAYQTWRSCMAPPRAIR